MHLARVWMFTWRLRSLGGDEGLLAYMALGGSYSADWHFGLHLQCELQYNTYTPLSHNSMFA